MEIYLASIITANTLLLVLIYFEIMYGINNGGE